jgi:hypothetical protein
MGFQNTALFRVLLAFKRSLLVAWILLVKQGYFRSVVKGAPVAANGEPLPWFTYPAIEYLKQFNFSDKRVFEYGAGNSSLFWAARAGEVVAVESDREWYTRISATCPPNLYLNMHADKENYVSCITRQNAGFDVIVIDGQWRNACAAVCVACLNRHGIIIIDNSDRHYKGSDLLRNAGFLQIDFNGFSPVNRYASTTSVFIHASTDIQAGYSQPVPAGGLEEYANDDD